MHQLPQELAISSQGFSPDACLQIATYVSIKNATDLRAATGCIGLARHPSAICPGWSTCSVRTAAL